MKFRSFCFCIPGSKNEAKQEDSDKSGEKKDVDDAEQGATTTTAAATVDNDAGVAAAVAVGATTANTSAVE
ncbi:hypothetical protein GQ457_07G034910 [Hibiscus cannabinus]